WYLSLLVVSNPACFIACAIITIAAGRPLLFLAIYSYDFSGLGIQETPSPILAHNNSCESFIDRGRTGYVMLASADLIVSPFSSGPTFSTLLLLVIKNLT